MTKEQLKEIRNSAFEEHASLQQLDIVFPLLYNLIFTKLIEDSKAFMDKLGETGEEVESEGGEGGAADTEKSE